MTLTLLPEKEHGSVRVVLHVLLLTFALQATLALVLVSIGERTAHVTLPHTVTITSIMYIGYVFPLLITVVMAILLEAIQRVVGSRHASTLLVAVLLSLFHVEFMQGIVPLNFASIYLYGHVYWLRQTTSMFEGIKLAFLCHTTWNCIALLLTGIYSLIAF